MNDSSKQPYTWQDVQDGVIVISFTDRGDGHDPDATYTADIADFEERMASLAASTAKVVAVIDFANHSMTAWDNGRAIVSTVLATHQRLRAKGGGLLVCNHPAQFSPDLQPVLHFDRAIGIYRTRCEAMEAARGKMRDSVE